MPELTEYRVYINYGTGYELLQNFIRYEDMENLLDKLIYSERYMKNIMIVEHTTTDNIALVYTGNVEQYEEYKESKWCENEAKNFRLH